MTKHKALLALLVVGVLFVGAATAHASYCEKWSNGWLSGTIVYNGKTYNHAGSSGYTWCWERGDDCDMPDPHPNGDEFQEDYSDGWARFVTSDDEDTLYFTDTTYSSHVNEGCKITGRSGTKEGQGTWCAYEHYNGFIAWGTWDTLDEDDYFDYRPATPTSSGNWDLGGANDQQVTSGQGTWGGALLSYENPCTSISDD